MKITGNTRELSKAVRQLSRLTSSTLPLAAAKALTKAAQAVARAMPAEVARSLDRPTPFTANASALYIQPATPGNLTAVVGYKDRQARYLRWQVEGGKRTSKGAENALKGMGAMPASGWYAVPGRGAPLDGFGNIPRKAWTAIFAGLRASAAAQRGGGAGRAGSARRVRYVAVLPGQGSRLAPGVWLHSPGAGGGTLQAILIYVKDAQYKPRFKFEEAAARVVRAEFSSEFNRALSKVLQSYL